MNERDVLSILLILGAVVDVAVTSVLIRAANREHEPALTERAIASSILTAAACSIAVLAVAYLFRVQVPPTLSFVLLSVTLLALSVPQVVWWASYLAGRFR